MHPEQYRSWVVSTLKTGRRYRSLASESVALEKTKAWEAVRAWMHLRKAYLHLEELELSIERENREGIQTQTIEQELQAKSIYALRVVKRELQTTKDKKELSREAELRLRIVDVLCRQALVALYSFRRIDKVGLHVVWKQAGSPAEELVSDERPEEFDQETWQANRRAVKEALYEMENIFKIKRPF